MLLFELGALGQKGGEVLNKSAGGWWHEVGDDAYFGRGDALLQTGEQRGDSDLGAQLSRRHLGQCWAATTQTSEWMTSSTTLWTPGSTAGGGGA